MAIKPPPSPTKPSNPPPSALTFPALTFAKLSPSAYLSAHLNSPHGALRPSGRKPTQSRPPTCHTGSLTHTHGSAVVRCGDTAVVCGVRGEILKVDDIADYQPAPPNNDTPEAETPRDQEAAAAQRRKADTTSMAHLSLLVPNLELSTGCSPSHLPGGPPSPLAQTLTQRILTLLHTSQLLSLDDLRIWSQPPSPPPPTTTPPTANPPSQPETELEELTKPETKAFWTLYIDLLFISLSGSTSALDIAWFAILAALKSTRLPRAWWDTDLESVLCSPLSSEAKPLQLHDVPVALTFGVFHGEREGGKEKREGGKWILADPDGFEEALCGESVTVVVGARGKIVRVEKSGGVGVGGLEMRGLVELAGERREEWIRVVGWDDLA